MPSHAATAICPTSGQALTRPVIFPAGRSAALWTPCAATHGTGRSRTRTAAGSACSTRDALSGRSLRIVSPPSETARHGRNPSSSDGHDKSPARCTCLAGLFESAFWRRERDLNPRRCDPQRFSRPPQSAALPSLREKNDG